MWDNHTYENGELLQAVEKTSALIRLPHLAGYGYSGQEKTSSGFSAFMGGGIPGVVGKRDAERGVDNSAAFTGAGMAGGAGAGALIGKRLGGARGAALGALVGGIGGGRGAARSYSHGRALADHERQRS